MAERWYSQGGSGDASSASTPGDIAAITWGAGDTHYIIGNITDTLSVGGSGTEESHIILNLEGATFARSTTANDISFSGRSYIDVIGGTFNRTTSATNGCIYLVNSHHLSFTDLAFDTADSYAINAIVSDTSAIHDITIDGIDATNIQNSKSAIRVAIWPSSLEAYKNITIKNSSFIDCHRAYEVYYGSGDAGYVTTVITNGLRPTGLQYTDNYHRDLTAASVLIPGFGGTGADQSIVDNNVFVDCGKSPSTLVNTIQTGNNTDLIIQRNTIIRPHTDGTGDGIGIIVDWKGTGTLPSERVVVRRNYIEGATSVSGAAGISVWSAKDTLVYGNICVGNNYGIKIHPITGRSGNIVANNLCINNVTAGGVAQLDNDEISYWYNNIFMGSGTGLVDEASGAETYLVESNNCYWDNSTDYSGSLTNSVQDDPELDADYLLSSTSPCLAAGLMWFTGANPPGYDGEPLANFEIDIGHYQAKYSPFHPTNI